MRNFETSEGMYEIQFRYTGKRKAEGWKGTGYRSSSKTESTMRMNQMDAGNVEHRLFFTADAEPQMGVGKGTARTSQYTSMFGR